MRTRTIIFFAALLLIAPALCAQDFSSINLWNSEVTTGPQQDYATYRIPGIIVTRRGTVLAYAVGRRTHGSDWADADILLRRSTDGGRTFSPSRRIAGAGRTGIGNAHITTDNPTAVADRQTGAVYLLYQVNYARCYVIISHDDGLTFSAPRDITDALTPLRSQFNWNVIAPGPTHGIQARNGRIIVPLWMADGPTRPDGTRAHAPSAVTTLYSDDHGRTWHAGDIAFAGNDEIKNPSETTVVQLTDGRVLLNMRNESANSRRVLAVSPDGATHWSAASLDNALFEPICDAGLVRYPARQGRPAALLFSNPDSAALPHSGNHYPRQRLTVRASFDDGRSWPDAKLMDPGVTGYSDLAVLPDGEILCLYENGSIGSMQGDPNHITLARFTMDWLLAN